MACFGEYEIVSQDVTVSPANTDVTFTVDAPTGKKVLFGWEDTQAVVTLLHSHPSEDGTAWEFVLRTSSSSASATLSVTCALLD